MEQPEIEVVEKAKLETLFTMRGKVVAAKSGSLQFLSDIKDKDMSARQLVVIDTAQKVTTEISDALIAEIDRMISEKDY